MEENLGKWKPGEVIIPRSVRVARKSFARVNLGPRARLKFTSVKLAKANRTKVEVENY